MDKERMEWVLSGIDSMKLNGWEQEFVRDVEAFFDETGFLTPKQEAKLEQIYREKGV